MKGTLFVEHSIFSSVSRFQFDGFSRNSVSVTQYSQFNFVAIAQ